MEPNLPGLEKNATVSLPPQAGRWMSENVRLADLAESLDLPESATRRDLKSVPDVWAQVLAFQNALIQEGHPLAAQAEREWRGLLALFGLARVYDRAYRLELQPLDLDAEAGRAGAPFRRVLTALKPTTGLFAADAPGSGDWGRPVLLWVRDLSQASHRVVGVLNPATLVAPGKSAREVRMAEVPWAREGFSDPTALTGADALPARDYAVLAAFLESLEQALSDAARTSDPTRAYNALVGRLTAYRTACRRLSEGYGRDRLEAAVTPIGGPGHRQALYAPLATAFAPSTKGDPDRLSDCRVPLREDAGVFKGLILLDETLTQTLGRRAQDIHVWGHHTLKAVLEQRELRDSLRRETAQAGWLLVEPDDFFTREFVRLGETYRVAGHGPYGPFADAVLPLSPLPLMALAPDSLLKALGVDDLGDGGRTVHLDLPLDGGMARHRLSRTFRADAGPTGFNAMSGDVAIDFGIAAWPDFQHPAWRWNLLRLVSEKRGSKLRARFGMSARLLAKRLGEEATAEARATAAHDWFAADTLIEKTAFPTRVSPEPADGRPAPAFQWLRYVEDDESVEELQVAASPFEAVCLARSRVSGEPPRPVGLVLLPRAADVTVAGGATTVAVDFGTTNTVAAIAGESQAVTFKSRVRVAIQDPRTEEFYRYFSKWSFVDFLPLFDTPTPVPTVAKRRDVSAASEPALQRVESGDDNRLLFSDLIYFQPPPDPNPNETDEDIKVFARQKDRLTFNLKWGVHTETARRFLRQFMLMTAAELLASGRDPRQAVWRFSYPEAMSDTLRDVLLGGVRKAWASLFADVEDGVAPPPEHPVRPLTTEGGAAAKYFIGYDEKGQSAGRLLIVLDIGGGTTDIAVIRDKKPLWRDSFRLAGGDFITHYIVNNPGLFEKIKLPDFARLRRGFAADRTSSLYASADADGRLKAFGELLFSNRKFPAAMKANFLEALIEPEGRGLRNSAWTYLGGMLFYMGMVARALIDQGLIRPQELETVTFGLGGRGATFFKDFGGEGPRAPLRGLLACFRHGAGLPEDAPFNPTPLMSRESKMEVVLGMVSAGDAEQRLLDQLSDVPRSRTVPLGEPVRLVDGGELAPESDVADLPAGREFDEPTLDGLKRFLSALARETPIRIDLMPGRHDGAESFIRNKVLSTLSEQVDDRTAAAADDPEADPLRIEPPFITGLRALLDRLGRPAEERAGFIVVKER